MEKIKTCFILLIFIFQILAFSPVIMAGCDCEEWQSWSNEYGELSVFPRTSHNMLFQKQYWFITCKQSIEIDVAFRFNYSLSKGGLYYYNNGNYTKLEVEHFNYGIYHYYVYFNFNAIAEKNYSGYWEYDTPINSSGKWDMFIKRSIDPFGTWRIHLDPYWDTDYGSRVDLYTNASQIPATLTNFPVRVYINGSTHMNDFTQADLDDIVFVNSDNDTVLDYELENYTKVGGKLYANYWVKIPSLSGATNTHFNMYYNNTGATSQENPTGVWDSNFIGVFHMSDSDNIIEDSSSYGNDFLEIDNPTFQYTGKCGYGIDLDGTNDAFYNNGVDLTGLTESTLECWNMPDYLSGGSSKFIFGSRIDTTDDWRFSYVGDGSNSLYNYYQDDGVVDGCSGSTFTPASDTWYYSVMTAKNGGYIYGYRNGKIDNYDSSVNFNYGLLDNLHRIGCRYLNSNNIFYDGTFDEFRISNIQRSQNWIITSYNTMLNFTDNKINGNPFILWGNKEDFYWQPTLTVDNIFPSNNSYWCNYIVNLTNLSARVICPYGTSFNIRIEFLGVTYTWLNVYNGTYNISLLDKIPIGTTNYSWILNVTSNFCVELGGYCYYEEILYFNACWDALIYLQISNELGSDNIEWDLTQLSLFIEIIMFWLFMYIGFTMEANNKNGGSKKVWSVIPIASGFIQMFGSIALMSMGATLATYLNPYFAGVIVSAGIALLVYSFVKAFYHN